jgi:hypothetical protein
MKKDQLLSRRRLLLAGAAVLGAAVAAGAAGLLLEDDPVRPARGALAAPGPGARTRRKPSTFRLRPVTCACPAVAGAWC